MKAKPSRATLSQPHGAVPLPDHRCAEPVRPPRVGVPRPSDATSDENLLSGLRAQINDYCAAAALKSSQTAGKRGNAPHAAAQQRRIPALLGPVARAATESPAPRPVAHPWPAAAVPPPPAVPERPPPIRVLPARPAPRAAPPTARSTAAWPPPANAERVRARRHRPASDRCAPRRAGGWKGCPPSYSAACPVPAGRQDGNGSGKSCHNAG